MSLPFSNGSLRSGTRCCKASISYWVGHRFEERSARGWFTDAISGIHDDLRRCVMEGSLFPDFGPTDSGWDAGATALEMSEVVPRFIDIPVDLDRQFARLARAHGLTVNAALCMLLKWRAAHGWQGE